MSIQPEILELAPDMRAWRHALHRRPELAFQEAETAAFVAERLSAWGLDVATGIAGTGVVGTLRAGSTDRAIGLRAELDALPIEEASGRAYASEFPGRMHACGHDGHAAMLLGAAKHLSERPAFDGTVRFIFQPAEENEGGGLAMLEDGLLERFDVESVYGMHNWPGMPVGNFGVRAGPITASLDLFEIVVEGRGGHAAMPHHGDDVIGCAAGLVPALDAIVARGLNPLDSAVLSVTWIDAGNAWNVLPDKAMLRGTVRAFEAGVRDTIERRMGEVVASLPGAYGCVARLDYRRGYPATVNSPESAQIVAEVLRGVAGEDGVDVDVPATTAAEDFAYMLQQRPGAYVFIGNGDSAPVHTPAYDFDDDALPWGAQYWVALVRRLLAAPAP